MTSYNFDSLSNFDRIIFDNISKKKASSYILDYVTKEYEAIIPCFPIKSDHLRSSNNPDQFFKSKRRRDKYQDFNHTGLPSPPLSSSPERKSYKRSSSSTHRYHTRPSQEPIALRCYIESVVKKSRIDTGTLLTSLSYARRLKSKLSHTSKGMECTHHRIFLATLIITSKYIHDSAIKNKYWVNYACQLFSGSEINLMEKQLLQLLDYNLKIDDFETIASNVVQLHYQEHELKRKSPNNMHLLDQLDWYPHDKKQYNDSAYASASSSTSSSYLSSIPIASHNNTSSSITPPLISFD